MSEYESSTPSSIDTFPSPVTRDAFNEDSKPQLYGPASLSADVIMVPPSPNEGEGSATVQTKEEEVIMLASLAELDLSMLDSWKHKENMTWLKCMLTKHLPQPQPAEVSNRMQVLKQIEAEIEEAKAELQLEDFVRVFEKFEQKLGVGIARKLNSELNSWRQVRDALLLKSVLFNELQEIGDASQVFFTSCLLAPTERENLSPNLSDKGPGDHLWEHILRLLMNEDPTVEWLDKENGLFKFVDSSGAARSWGMTKGNQNMSYEKMSRSIRQYYTEGKNGIIQKAVEHPKLHYRYNMTHPEVIKFLKANFLDVCLRDSFMSGLVTRE